MDNVIHLENNMLEIKGATKVVSSTSTQAVVQMGEREAIISGSDIEVKSLNLEEQNVLLCGNFSNIKLGEAHGKKAPLFKRIFK